MRVSALDAVSRLRVLSVAPVKSSSDEASHTLWPNLVALDRVNSNERAHFYPKHLFFFTLPRTINRGEFGVDEKRGEKCTHAWTLVREGEVVFVYVFERIALSDRKQWFSSIRS